MKRESSNASSIETPAQQLTGQYESVRIDQTLVEDPEDADDMDADITPEEIALLDAAEENNSAADNAFQAAQLDTTDEDGVALEEKGFADDVTGEDLDVPGAEADDDDEALGEEDEENNNYSEADTE